MTPIIKCFAQGMQKSIFRTSTLFLFRGTVDQEVGEISIILGGCSMTLYSPLPRPFALLDQLMVEISALSCECVLEIHLLNRKYAGNN